MLFYALCALAIVLLILLYHRLRSRRVFLFFCIALAVAAGFAYALTPSPAAPQMTPAERQDLMEQQAIFADWQKTYQQDLKSLDRNWQRYHQILEDFSADRISIETASERLAELEANELELSDRLGDAAPPAGLHADLSALVAALQKKTADYANQEMRAISLTHAATLPEYRVSEDQAEQARSLRNIMEKESPAQLFTASELTSIKNLLAAPDATPAKETN